MHAFSLENKEFQNITLEFTNLLENALDKITYLIFNKEKIPKKIFNFLKSTSYYFDEYIWLPYASYISSQTVKGIRAEEEKRKRINQKIDHLINSNMFIKSFPKIISDQSLFLSWKEAKYLYDIKYKDRDIDKILFKTQKIYDNIGNK